MITLALKAMLGRLDMSFRRFMSAWRPWQYQLESAQYTRGVHDQVKQSVHKLVSAGSEAISQHSVSKPVGSETESRSKRKFTLSRAFLLTEILWLELDSSWRFSSAARCSATRFPSTNTSDGRSANRPSSTPKIGTVKDSSVARNGNSTNHNDWSLPKHRQGFFQKVRHWSASS